MTDLQQAVTEFCAEVERARRSQDRGHGGQHVPYHGDFASAHPGMMRSLVRWAERFAKVRGEP